MERVAPAGDVYQAGTLSGNPLATAAGLATLRLLDAGRLRPPRAHSRARSPTGLEAAAADAGVPVQVAWTTGLLTVFFSEEPVHDYDGAKRCDTDATAPSAARCSSAGVYLPPSQFEAWFPSLAHGESHVERTLDAARAAFCETL